MRWDKKRGMLGKVSEERERQMADESTNIISIKSNQNERVKMNMSCYNRPKLPKPSDSFFSFSLGQLVHVNSETC